MANAKTKLIDYEVERAALGACLVDPAQLIEVINIIQPDAFYLESNRLVYRAMIDLFEEGIDIDLMTVADSVKAYANLEDIGTGAEHGMAYLISLTTAEGVYSYNAAHYARIVSDLHRRRQVVNGCQVTVKQAMDRSIDLVETVEMGSQLLLGASANGVHDLAPMGVGLDEYQAEIERRYREGDHTNPGIATGYTDIDNLTGGLAPHQLWIVAGRPGMGKTAWMIGAMYHLSIMHEYNGAFFSLEMGREEIYKRLAAYRTKLNLQDLARGKFTKIQKNLWDTAMEFMYEASDRLWIDDTAGLTPAQMKARAIKMDTQVGLDYIMVDFLQLVYIPSAAGNKYVQATEASRELKNLAKYLGIPVVAACQLSRAPEAREDKRPQLADLRDSGGIEEAADVVGMVFRPDYYHKDGEPTFLIAKQRSGPMGIDVQLTWFGTCAAYYNGPPPDLKQSELIL